MIKICFKNLKNGGGRWLKLPQEKNSLEKELLEIEEQMGSLCVSYYGFANQSLNLNKSVDITKDLIIKFNDSLLKDDI